MFTADASEVDTIPTEGQTAAANIPVAQRPKILLSLEAFRLAQWQDVWRAQFPSDGPNSLIDDVDLEYLAANARSISSLAELKARTHILHIERLGPPLLVHLQEIVESSKGTCVALY